MNQGPDSTNNRILFTGGGTGGHVLPCLPLIEYFRERSWTVSFIGSTSGLEERLLGHVDLNYHGIATGKLRRYFSLQNLSDIFRILYGLVQATRILVKEKPRVVFSKGGYVSLPVVIAAWLQRIPVVAHESDVTPGLANRLALPFLKAVCVNFEETEIRKSVYTGTPVRDSLLKGSIDAGRIMAGITPGNSDQKILLVVGGSLGADSINTVVRESLVNLNPHFHVVHVCGPGKCLSSLEGLAHYRQFEFVAEGWGDLLAAADIVLSRAGANAVYELLILQKPSLLVPLSLKASRGDQIVNAALMQKQGYSQVLAEEEFTAASLVHTLAKMLGSMKEMQFALNRFRPPDALQRIIAVLKKYMRT